MPIPIPEAIAESAELARTKAVGVTRLHRFLVAALLAGAYIGIGIVATLAGNLGGSLLFAWVVDKGGTLYARTATGAPGRPGH